MLRLAPQVRPKTRPKIVPTTDDALGESIDGTPNIARPTTISDRSLPPRVSRQNVIDLQATLRINTQPLTIHWRDQQLKLEGLAELDVLDASTRLSTLHPVGSYRMRMQGGAVPTLTLQTLSGSLQLSGAGQFTGNRWRFSGEATAAPNAEAALSNFLDIVGRRIGPRSIITLG